MINSDLDVVNADHFDQVRSDRKAGKTEQN